MKLTQEEYENRVYNVFKNEYTVIGEYTGIYDKIKIKHNECKKIYYPVARDLITGRGCSHCYGRKRLSQDKAFTEIKKVLGNDYTILDTYKNSITPLKIKHEKCGNIYKASHNNIKKTLCKCPFCKQKSKGESIIKHVLNNYNITFIDEKRFEDCRCKHTLPFDFYLPDYNMCIEYQGIQHYKPVEKFGGVKSFKDAQNRDNIKRLFCNKNNITLLEIKYTEIKNIENILLTKLNI